MTAGFGPVVGVDIGGTKIAAALATADGHIIRRQRLPTPASEGPEAVIDAACRLIDRVRGQASGDQVSGIGVGFPGPYNSRLNVVSSSPHLAGWRDVPLKQMLAERLALPVFIDNDANAAALGEHRFGAGAGTQHMVYITVSTGIGGGLILDGALYGGALGAAGEIGHMTIDVNGPECHCGGRGCWEAMVSGTALARDAVKALNAGVESGIRGLAGGDLTRVTAELVSQAAQQGDRLARSLIDRAAYHLGVGLANVINIFNPEMIVIGGGLSYVGEALLGPAEAVARERAFAISAGAVTIVPAKLRDDAGVLGAVALAFEGLAGRR